MRGFHTRNILIVSYSYAPVIDPRSFRWTAIAEELAKRGHTVTVVSSWHPGLPRFETQNGVQVQRAGGGIVQRLRRMLLRGDTHTSPAVAHIHEEGNAARPSRFASIARAVYRHTWKRLLWPDHAALWYFPAVRIAKMLVADRRVDTLISVSHPFTGHLVGLGVRRSFPGLRWLIDCGDAFYFRAPAQMGNLGLYRALDYRKEKEVIGAAEAVVFCTEGLAREYRARFPESAAQIAYVPPLHSSAGMEPEESNYFTGDGTIRFLFVGTLYQDIRNPGYMLKLVARVQEALPGRQVELHIMGAINDCQDVLAPFENMKRPRVVIHGVLPRATALSAMASADVLVNIANAETYGLPSKVVDYAWSGRPIINITRGDLDGCAAFFAHYQQALTLRELPNGPTDGQIEGVLSIIQPRRPSIAREQLRELLEPYSLDAVVSAYEMIMAGSTAQESSTRAHPLDRQI